MHLTRRCTFEYFCWWLKGGGGPLGIGRAGDSPKIPRVWSRQGRGNPLPPASSMQTAFSAHINSFSIGFEQAGGLQAYRRRLMAYRLSLWKTSGLQALKLVKYRLKYGEIAACGNNGLRKKPPAFHCFPQAFLYCCNCTFYFAIRLLLCNHSLWLKCVFWLLVWLLYAMQI